MKKKINQFLLLAFMLAANLLSSPVKAQVNIGSLDKPHPFSILELTTTDKVKGGLRLPQLNSAERSEVQAEFNANAETAKAAQGLVIYNTDTNCVEYWSVDHWVSLCNDAMSIVFTSPGGDPRKASDIVDITTPFPADGQTLGPMVPHDTPECTTANPYTISIKMGSGYTSFTNTNPATGEFTVTMDPNSSDSPRYAIISVTNNCKGESQDFILTQEGGSDVNNSITITLSSGVGTDAQTLCVGSTITDITYSTTGAMGATITGLPNGVIGNWDSNVVTITGTPTESGTFDYTVTLTGGTGTGAVTGNITVNEPSTLAFTDGSQNQDVTENATMITTVYTFGGSATNATVTGLPAGVSYDINTTAKTVTISGTPTDADGEYDYTITTSGHASPCTAATIMGKITITACQSSTLALTSGTPDQTVCQSNSIVETVYTFGGSATNATVTGLPAGLNQSVNTATKTVTINGYPTASGTYTITTSGETPPCTAATISGTITVNASDFTQDNPAAATICYNATNYFPLAAATGGSGAITYQWQQSTDNNTWSNAGGSSTSADYTTPALTSNMYYRRLATAATCGGTITSNSALVTVAANFTQGNPTAASICYNATTTLTLAAATGGSGAISYQWQQSTNNSSWSNATGTSTGTNYTTPALTTSTYFRRVATADNCGGPITSNSALVTVAANFTQSNPTGASICSGTTNTFTLAAATGGSGTITYQWQQSTTSSTSGFSNVSGATGANYTTPALTATTYYRRVATASTCGGSITSNAAAVTIKSFTQPTVVSGQTGFTMCKSFTFITNTGPATGFTGTVTYQWQTSSNGTTGWTAGDQTITPNNGQTYSIQVVSTVKYTIYIRRAATAIPSGCTTAITIYTPAYPLTVDPAYLPCN